MKTVLCDINFILDIFLKRETFYYSAAILFKKIEEKKDDYVNDAIPALTPEEFLSAIPL